jgi:hypothetical protein
MTDSHVSAPEAEPYGALVLHEEPVVVDLIKLTLTHGAFVVRSVGSLAEAEGMLEPPEYSQSASGQVRCGRLHGCRRVPAPYSSGCRDSEHGNARLHEGV